MSALIWGGIAILGAIGVAAAAVMLVRDHREDARAARRTRARQDALLAAALVEEDAEPWWDATDDKDLPPALQAAGDSQRAFPAWRTGAFWAADLALVREAMEQGGEAS